MSGRLCSLRRANAIATAIAFAAIGNSGCSSGGAARDGGAGTGGGTGTGGSAGTGGSGAGTGGTIDGGSGGAGAVDGAAGASGQWVMGYYVGYDIDAYPIASIDWTGLTHVIFSPLTVNADQSLNLDFSDQHGTGQADAMALAQAAHAHGVQALLMLGGEGAGANIAAAATAAHRAAFVSALVGAMATLGYDGIDLDWEDSVNLDDLVSLAQALRAARPGMLLTYPAGTINGNIDTVDPRMATLAASLDRFNVQTYYPSTAFAGSGWSSWFVGPLSGAATATPIAIDDTLGRYAAAGIPKSKLGMGMAFYAICYTGGITAPRQPTDGTSQQIVGGDNSYPLGTFFASGGTFDRSAAGDRRRDSTAAEPYLSLTTAVNDPGCGAPTQYISYEDETSIAAKGAFSKANGYGGIIIWTLEEGWLPTGASGGRAPNALMQALKTAFIDP
jgi:chitinase